MGSVSRLWWVLPRQAMRCGVEQTAPSYFARNTSLLGDARHCPLVGSSAEQRGALEAVAGACPGYPRTNLWGGRAGHAVA
jgi:hypothetical protein